jgi:hypothetical protein
MDHKSFDKYAYVKMNVTTHKKQKYPIVPIIPNTNHLPIPLVKSDSLSACQRGVSRQNPPLHPYLRKGFGVGDRQVSPGITSILTKVQWHLFRITYIPHSNGTTNPY